MKRILIIFLVILTLPLVGQKPFITTWKTTELDEEITIPTMGTGYNYDVNWGDGQVSNGHTTNATHGYTKPGSYKVSISGNFPRIFFNNDGDKNKIISINQWGSIKWKSMKDAFHGCTSLNGQAVDVPDLSLVTDMSRMFALSTFNQNIGNWNVSDVTNMQAMFFFAKLFNQDISGWDVSKVVQMSKMFRNAEFFDQDIGSWNVENVIFMNFMFTSAKLFNQDISGWDVSKVVQMTGMFAATDFFNQDIGNWNVKNVNTMKSMFNNAKSFNQNLSKWNVSNVTDMKNMFTSTKFNQDIRNWNVSKVIDMTAMFGNTPFNQNIGSWNVENVIRMRDMFFGAKSFNQNLGKWNVGKVTDMRDMFFGVTLSTSNYDSLLIGWNKQNLEKGVQFSAGNSMYCKGNDARSNMISSYNWNISDKGKDGNCNSQAPTCTTDTINIVGDLSKGYGTVVFTDYVSDDGVVSFVQGFDQGDFPVTNVDTFPCNTNFGVNIWFEDDDGNMVFCFYTVIIDCVILDTCQNIYLDFDGQDDRIILPNQHTGNVDFTLECVFLANNIIDNGTNSFHRLFTLGTSNRMEIGDQLGRLLYYDGNSRSIGSNIRDNQWHHIAIVRKSPFVNVYLDGSIIMNEKASAVDLNSLRVGFFDNKNLESVTMWRGGIDEIKLWDYALSDQEVNQSMLKSNTNKQDCGLIGYWALEDGVPGSNNSMLTEVMDSTLNNNGTLYGFDLQHDTSNFVCHDSIEIVYDPTGCCQIAIFHSTQCNIIDLNSAPLGFNKDSLITYLWTSPNTNFETTVADTVWVYQGDLSLVIICLEATDGNCTVSTCDTIQVSQPIPPLIENCIDKISLPYTSECGVLIGIDPPSAFDSCQNKLIISVCFRSDSLALDERYPVGITVVTCIATSLSGLSDTCFTEINVLDETPPECLPITHQFYLDKSGHDSIQLIDLPIPGIDECSEVFYNNSELFLKVDCFPSAGKSVDIQDEYGNTAECIVTFQVLDTIGPICIVQDQGISAIPGQDSVIVAYNYKVTDNCPDPKVKFSIPEGSLLPCGYSDNITLTVEDNFGNISNCTFILSVSDCIDYYGTITGHVFEDFNCNNNLDNNEVSLDQVPIAVLSKFGNDTIKIVLTDVLGMYSIDSIPVGDYRIVPLLSNVKYKVTFPIATQYLITVDSFNLFEELDFGLSYNGPVANIVSDKDCYFEGDTIQFTWDYDRCKGDDCFIQMVRFACGSNNQVQIISTNPTPGEFQFVVGKVTRPTGNKFALSFCDGQAIFDCISIYPSELDFKNEIVGCKEFKFTSPQNYFDNYEWSFGDGQIDVDGGSAITHAYSKNGKYEVCLTVVTDKGCEKTFCNDLIVEGECDDCNISYESSENGCYELVFSSTEENYESLVAYEWTVNDNSGIGPVIFSTKNNPFVIFDGPGEYEVCLSASDVVCEDTYCRSYKRDTIYAIFKNCPLSTIELFTNKNCDQVYFNPNIDIDTYCRYVHDETQPPIIFSRSDGLKINDPYSIGITSVQVSFTDYFEITTNCYFNVDVSDTISPICDVKDLTIALDETGFVSIDFEDIDRGSMDNCSNINFSLSQNSFSCQNIGLNTVKIEINDGTNKSTCEAKITIDDGSVPTCEIPPHTFYLDRNGEFVLTQGMLDIDAKDNCTIQSIELSQTNFDCRDLGDLNIQVTVKDQSGNTTICDAEILIADTISPLCFVKDIALSIGESGIVIIESNIFQSMVSDNCTMTAIELSKYEFNCDNIGNNEIVLTLSDASGNISYCSVNISITDSIAPTCMANDIELQAEDENGAFVMFDVSTSDNCDLKEIDYSMPNNQIYPCGEYTITMNAIDKSGNQTMCEFNIIVKDCDACCLSESAFIDLTNQGIRAKAKLQNGANCIVQIYPPSLTDCQVITQLDWDDGTITNGQFPSNIEFKHEYIDAGRYNVCVTMEETDNGDCFSNQVCISIEITNDCRVVTSIENIRSEDIIIYPNPSNSNIHIKSTERINTALLFNTNGQLIPIDIENNTIDLSNINEGIYMLKLKIGTKIFFKKIVKID